MKQAILDFLENFKDGSIDLISFAIESIFLILFVTSIALITVAILYSLVNIFI